MREAFNRVNAVLSSLEEKRGDLLPIQLDDIKRAVTEACPAIDEVVHFIVPADECEVAGKFKLIHEHETVYAPPSRTTAEIQIRQGHNLCWTRFTFAKELSQCVLDMTETRVTNEQEYLFLAEALTLEKEARSQLGEGMPRYINDRMAENIAVELLIPRAERLRFLKLYEGGHIKELGLAEIFKVPQYLISTVFNRSYIAGIDRMLNGKTDVEEDVQA